VPNVLRFQTPPGRSSLAAPAQQASESVKTELLDPQLLTRLIELQTEAKGEVKRVVSLLDLLVSHVGKAASRIADPDTKKTIVHELVLIEEALQLARKMAMDL